MFIIDFDDTLFDTHAFKRSRLAKLQAAGVSEELFWQTYQEARNTPDGLFSYSNQRHAEVLALRGFDEEKVFALLEETVTPGHLRTLLLEGAIEFLQQLKSFGQPMILLSLGHPESQEEKVKGSGVHPYFDRSFMVEESKEEILRELFHDVHESVAWFINDKVQETLPLVAAFPQMNIVLKVSPNIPIHEYVESGLPHFPTLAEIEAYVRAHRT